MYTHCVGVSEHGPSPKLEIENPISTQLCGTVCYFHHQYNMFSLFSLLFLIGRFESLISTGFLGDFFIGTFDVRVTRTIPRQPTTPRGPYQWANPLELRQFSEKSPLIILKSLLLYHRISPLHIHYSYISYIWRCPIHWGTPSFHPFLVGFSTNCKTSSDLHSTSIEMLGPKGGNSWKASVKEVRHASDQAA